MPTVGPSAFVARIGYFVGLNRSEPPILSCYSSRRRVVAGEPGAAVRPYDSAENGRIVALRSRKTEAIGRPAADVYK
jgi:hypothetical protein